ncbi:MAG: hypothetical protein HPY72_02655 [Anaerolineae bacterium]|nr:hypothetical protein [Anaerolineae bacterium]
MICKTKTIGVVETVRNLEKYLNINYSPIEEVLLINGVHVDNRIELFENVYLYPYEEIKIGHDYGSLITNLETLRLPHTDLSFTPPHSAIVFKNHSLQKITKEFEVSEESEHREIVHEICLALRLICNISPLPLIYFFQFEEWCPFSLTPVGWSESYSILWEHNFQPQDIEIRAIPRIEKCHSLLKEDKAKILLALHHIRDIERTIYSLTEWAISTRIILETLFLTRNEENGLFTYKVAIRGAKFLEGDLVQKIQNMKDIKDSYGYGSKAVHNGIIEKEISDKAKRNLCHTKDLIMKSICKIIDKKGFPDWDNLILE